MGNSENARAIFHPPESAAASLATGAYALASASLSTVAQQAQKYTGATGAAIALKEGDHMLCHASCGDTSPDVGVELRLGGTFAGLCVQSGQMMQCNDAETDSRVDAAAARALGTRSMVITPIHHQGTVAGILAVYSPVAYAFKERHIVILKTMSEVISEILGSKTPEEASAIAAGQPASLDKAAAPRLCTAPAGVEEEDSAPIFTKPAPLFAPARPSAPVAIAQKQEPISPLAKSGSVTPVPLAETVERPVRTETTRPPARAEVCDNNPAIFPSLVARESLWERFGRRLLPAAAVLIVGLGVAGFWIFRGQSRAETNKPVPDVMAMSVPAPATQPAADTATPSTPVPPPDSRPESSAPPSTKESVEATIFAAPKEPLPTAMRVAPDLRPSNLGSRSAPRQPAEDASDEPPSVSLEGSGTLVSVPDVPKTTPILVQQTAKASQVTPSQVIRRVAPVYPEMARRSGIQGSVLLRAIVTRQGKLRDVRVVSGNPVFHASAVAAVEQWLYKPGYLNGEPTETTTEITLTFRLPK